MMRSFGKRGQVGVAAPHAPGRAAPAIPRTPSARAPGQFRRLLASSLSSLRSQSGLADFLGILFDVLTFLTSFFGSFVFFAILVIAAVVIEGFFFRNWIAVLYLLKFYPTPFAGAFPLFTLYYFYKEFKTFRTSRVSGGGGYGGRILSMDAERHGFGSEWGRIKAHERLERGPLGLVLFHIERALPVLLMIGLVVFASVLVGNKNLQAAVGQRAAIQAEKLHLSEKYATVSEYLNLKFLEEYVAGIASFDKRPDYLVPELKGVKLVSFPDPPPLYEGSEVELEAELLIDPLSDRDSIITFSCALYDGNTSVQEGLVAFSGQQGGYQSTAMFPVSAGGEAVPTTVYCLFEKLPEISEEYKIYEAFITWSYHHVLTRTILRVYTQQREIREKLKVKGIDPLAHLRDSPYIDKDGSAKAQCVQECGLADLGLKLAGTMPLAESGFHYLTVKVFGSTLWGGMLQKVYRLELDLPDALALGNKRCHWLGEQGIGVGVYFGGEGEHAVVLDEQDSVITQINSRLGAGETVSPIFTCDMDVVEAGKDEVPSAATVFARVVYDYGGKFPGEVVVRDMPKAVPEVKP